MIIIKEPIWNGGKVMVGLAEHRLAVEGEIVEMEIIWKTKAGIRLYPYKYSISYEAAMEYPRSETKRYSGVWLRIIPLNSFQEIRQ